MTANASPAVLAPVDVAAVLAAMNLAEDVLHEAHKFHASPSGLKLAEARAAVARMAAELEAARAALGVADDDRGYTVSYWAARTMKHLRDAIAERATLRQRLEAAEADAARYRWLRDNLPPGTFGDFDVFNGSSWDAAIDAAIALQEPRP